MNSDPLLRGRGEGGSAPRQRRASRRAAAPLVAAVAVVVVAAALVVAALAAAAGGPPGRTEAVSVTAWSVGTVDLQGVPGQLTIVGAATGQVRLTGQLHWTGHGSAIVTRSDHGRVLSLSYRCARSSPCTENYRLVVPRRTAIDLRQPSGHVVIYGIAGPLRITADSVDVSATGLRSPSLAAVIRSGHLGATFDQPPRHVGVTLTSAQATLRLPADVGYTVSSQVTSGYIHVGVPQASGAARTVTARIVSGELELLPR